MSIRKSDPGNEKRCLKILAYIDQFVQDYGRSPTVQEISETFKIPGTGDVNYNIDLLETNGWITSARTKGNYRKTGMIRLTESGQQMLIKPPAEEIVQKPLFEPEKAASDGEKKTHPIPQKRVLDVSYVILSARISNRKAVRTINIPVLNMVAASFGTEIHSSDFSLSGLGPESYLNINQDMLPVRTKIEELFALEVSGDSMIEAGIQSGDYVILRQTRTAENGDMCVVWIDEKEATLKYFYREEKRIRLEPANSSIPPMLLGPAHTVTIQGKVVLVVRL